MGAAPRPDRPVGAWSARDDPVPSGHPHLVFYSDADKVGGAEQALGLLLARLSPGFRVSLLGPDLTVLHWLQQHRESAQTLEVGAPRRKQDLGALWSLRRTLRQLHPDLFQANLNTMQSCQYALLVAQSLPRLATVALEHSPWRAGHRSATLLKRVVSRRLSAHVAVAHSLASGVEEAAGLSPGRVRVIPNGIEDFPLPPARPRPRPVIGSIGRLEHLKGYDLLLRAAAGLDAGIMIVGDGPDQVMLTAMARDLGISSRLELVGWRPDARALLAEMDIFVLPSRMEGLPIVILEAMVAGLPVVATDVGDVARLVDGASGYVVAPEDARSMHDRLAMLVDDGEQRRRLGQHARARVLRDFGAETMVRSWEHIYTELLSSDWRDAAGERRS